MILKGFFSNVKIILLLDEFAPTNYCILNFGIKIGKINCWVSVLLILIVVYLPTLSQ
jgi:hypothetical protein